MKTKSEYPTRHGDQHEHGGSDELRIAWEDVGTSGGSRPNVDYYGGVVSNASGVNYMDWNYNSGTALLNLSAPTSPTILDDGLYAFMSVLAWNGAGVIDERATLSFLVITGGFPAIQIGSTQAYATGSGTGTAVVATLTSVFQCVAGNTVRASCQLSGGLTGRNASHVTTIQQIG